MLLADTQGDKNAWLNALREAIETAARLKRDK
jgi:hypothetical protein